MQDPQPPEKPVRFHHERPVIQWDEDRFGGFRITHNLEKFIPPDDWKVDPNDPSHFLPTYKPCTYRRLSFGTKRDQPWCKIHCLLFEDVVDHDTCVDCDKCVAPPNFVSIESLIDIEPDDTDETIVKKFKASRQKQNKAEVSDNTDTIRILEDCESFGPEFKDDDPVFSSDQPPSKYVVKRNQEEPRRRTDWAPCIHRQDSIDADCGGCGKLVCGCENCPLLGLVLNKKDCKECPHRQEN